LALIKDLSVAEPESSPGEIRIKLTNSAQGWHLLQTLRGHCEVDLLSGSEGTAVVVSGSPSGSRPILRRLDAWLREFGVETISLEMQGRTYKMERTEGSVRDVK
jgi:hypothetical protein